jgi:2-iminoacetate synthase
MTLRQELEAWPSRRIADSIAQVRREAVDAALAREERTLADLFALLSPLARPHLEAIALEARRLTRWHFGRTIQLYAPIYISNVCAADCPYCGFGARSGSALKRVTLTPGQIRAECEALSGQGFENVLLLTGEAPRVATVERIADAVRIAREYFASVSVEVYAMAREEYQVLFDGGLEGVTMYMETYDPENYARLHRVGQKQDYDFRLNALERAGQAGARKLGLGALLGLFDWRAEAAWMAIHARYLQKHCWQSAVSVSFPRLRHVPERFTIPAAVSDADLVQLMLALRLALPEVGFALSTRETAAVRDRLIPLGITMMSAGSSTRPGGYTSCRGDTTAQFETEDRRSPVEVVQAIIKAGYDPVWKDFDRAFASNG